MFVAADVVVLALRALGFVALLQAVGAALFVALLGRELAATLPRIVSVARAASLIALTLTVVYHVLLPARMAGTFAATFDPSLSALVLSSEAGAANVVRVVGLALLALSWDAPGRLAPWTRSAGVVLALGSFALTGHTAIHPQRWLLAPLLLAHVAVAAFWFGALVPLRQVAAGETAAVGGRVVAKFSRLAVRLVSALLLVGVAMALFFVRGAAELFTAYGGMIVAKTLGFGAALGLGALHKWRLGPKVAAGDAMPFRRSVAVEYAVLAAVVAATALMTALFAPEGLHASFDRHSEARHE